MSKAELATKTAVAGILGPLGAIHFSEWAGHIVSKLPKFLQWSGPTSLTRAIAIKASLPYLVASLTYKLIQNTLNDRARANNRTFDIDGPGVHFSATLISGTCAGITSTFMAILTGTAIMEGLGLAIIGATAVLVMRVALSILYKLAPPPTQERNPNSYNSFSYDAPEPAPSTDALSSNDVKRIARSEIAKTIKDELKKQNLISAKPTYKGQKPTDALQYKIESSVLEKIATIKAFKKQSQDLLKETNAHEQKTDQLATLKTDLEAFIKTNTTFNGFNSLLSPLSFLKLELAFNEFVKKGTDISKHNVLATKAEDLTTRTNNIVSATKGFTDTQKGNAGDQLDAIERLTPEANTPLHERAFIQSELQKIEATIKSIEDNKSRRRRRRPDTPKGSGTEKKTSSKTSGTKKTDIKSTTAAAANGTEKKTSSKTSTKEKK